MDNFKQASKLKLRFQTNRGPLSAEQLWDLNQTDLSNAVKAVKDVLTKDDDDELSFLVDTKTVDIENQLRFDILKDVYLTKKKERADALNVREKKQFEQKILSLISEKKDESLKNKSIEELEALLK